MTSETTTRPRLPRYKRAQTEVSFALTKRDLDILALVESFRLATSEHIQALAPGSSQGILRRLQKLFHAGYLDRLREEPVYGGGSQKMVYAITNKGVRELQKAGVIENPSAGDRNANNRGLRDLSMRHTLLISHIRAVVTSVVRSRPDMRLAFWKEGPETYDAIEVSLPEGYTRVPVAPDAFFSLEDPKGKMHFFLEADRGTMTVERFTRKLKAYAAYWREKRHHDKFSIRYFRVLTVTTSATRSTHLVRRAEEDEEVRSLGRLFLFSDRDNLRLEKPESMFERIWTTPNQEDPVSILGGASSKNPTKEDVPCRISQQG